MSIFSNRNSSSLTLTYAIAAVWLINGLFCKVLNLIPRHGQIVARILGEEHAPLLTKIIGVSEVLMAVWVVSKIKPRLCGLIQIALVLAMNVIEYTLAPDLLLFGQANLLVAIAFSLILFWHYRLYPHQLSAATFNR